MVSEYQRAGVLDGRSVRGHVAGPIVDEATWDRWRSESAVAAAPVRLADQTVRWMVLASGRLSRGGRDLSSRGRSDLFVLEDQWLRGLEEPVGAWWWRTGEGIKELLERRVRLEIGQKSNRSVQRWEIAGRSVHVFQESAEPWTVRTAIEALAAMGGWEVGTATIPAEEAETPLGVAVDVSKHLGDGLTLLLEAYGLRLHREMALEGGVVVERRGIYPVSRGRRVSVVGSELGRVGEAMLSVTSGADQEGGRSWTAKGSAWEIESTFELVPGWDPALAEPLAPDWYYYKGWEGFETYANVYRLWVLNEDGYFSGEPYGQAGFDLGAFFGQPGVGGQRVAFTDCLVLDETGRRKSIVVETSFDEGQTWSRYLGVVVVRTDRAGIYLDDPLLPGDYLLKAIDGVVRVRATASLRCPEPVRMTRWTGNPFRGLGRPTTLDVSDAFSFRRMNEQSIHLAGVRSGQLASIERDSTGAMASWLSRYVQRVGRQETSGPSAKAELAGLWGHLRVGDMLTGLSGGGREADGCAMCVRKVVCRWPEGEGSRRGVGRSVVEGSWE
ncbi:MAG: hypothetical protein IT442_11970 [Phycisphaeraceae bacterium]|nr:hypothetical protein [Phycisphaeraceae bacterium]